MKKFIFIAALLGFNLAAAANIGLLVVATGKYIQYVEPLVASAEKFFLKDHNVTYFIFTDQEAPQLPQTIYAFHPRFGWPLDTMKRYNAYYNNRELLKDQDYLFALDADMLFVGEVGDEILGERVATLHPGFIGQRGTYETNPASKACIEDEEGLHYYAGGFYGGSRETFFDMIASLIDGIEDDLSRDVIAVWHDESHWNRYCVDHPPTVILSPSYCYPENWELNYTKKIIALDKNHVQMRQ